MAEATELQIKGILAELKAASSDGVWAYARHFEVLRARIAHLEADAVEIHADNEHIRACAAADFEELSKLRSENQRLRADGDLSKDTIEFHARKLHTAIGNLDFDYRTDWGLESYDTLPQRFKTDLLAMAKAAIDAARGGK